MPSRRTKIPHRNRNRTGWWIFQEVEMWLADRKRKPGPRTRCTVWENTRLLKARSREEAYRKAQKFVMTGSGQKTQNGRWYPLGISLLLPVYEEIEDGAEILWEERGPITITKAKSLVRRRSELPVFDDSDQT